MSRAHSAERQGGRGFPAFAAKYHCPGFERERTDRARIRIAVALLAVTLHPAAIAAERGSAAPPEPAARLWHDLACMCGECDRLRLADCRCPFAAAERERIVEVLRERDLSRNENREAAYRAVLDDYVERYGTDVLASTAVKQEGRSVLGWVLPLIAALIGLGLLIAVVEHLRRRAERRAPHSDRETRHGVGTARKRVKRRRGKA